MGRRESPNAEDASSPQSSSLLASTTLTALSSASNVLFGLLRMKLAAVILGPIGIGQIGILQSSMGFLSTVGDLGVRQSGTRAFALVSDEDSTEIYNRMATSIVVGTAMIALMFSVLTITFAGFIADRLLEMPDRATDVRWIALGVGTNIAAGGPFVVLNGRADVRGLTISAILAATFGTIFALLSLMTQQQSAHIVIVIAVPITTYFFMLACCFRYLDIRYLSGRQGLVTFCTTIGTAIRDGKYLMIGFIAVSAAEAAVRIIITKNLGLTSTGLFTSMWTISIYYIHFLFMLTSYQFYPTITGIIGRKEDASSHISNQIILIVSLAAPIILLAVTLVAWWIPIIYSHDFAGAEPLFTYIALGDVFRLICYPLSFVLLAHGRFALFCVMKLLEATLFVGITSTLMTSLHTLAPSVAHLATQLCLATAYVTIVTRYCSTNLSRGAIARLVTLAAAVTVMLILRDKSAMAALAIGFIAGTFSVYAAIKKMWRMRHSQLN